MKRNLLIKIIYGVLLLIIGALSVFTFSLYNKTKSLKAANETYEDILGVLIPNLDADEKVVFTFENRLKDETYEIETIKGLSIYHSLLLFGNMTEEEFTTFDGENFYFKHPEEGKYAMTDIEGEGSDIYKDDVYFH